MGETRLLLGADTEDRAEARAPCLLPASCLDCWPRLTPPPRWPHRSSPLRSPHACALGLRSAREACEVWGQVHGEWPAQSPPPVHGGQGDLGPWTPSWPPMDSREENGRPPAQGRGGALAPCPPSGSAFLQDQPRVPRAPRPQEPGRSPASAASRWPRRASRASCVQVGVRVEHRAGGRRHLHLSHGCSSGLRTVWVLRAPLASSTGARPPVIRLARARPTQEVWRLRRLFGLAVNQGPPVHGGVQGNRGMWAGPSAVRRAMGFQPCPWVAALVPAGPRGWADSDPRKPSAFPAPPTGRGPGTAAVTTLRLLLGSRTMSLPLLGNQQAQSHTLTATAGLERGPTPRRQAGRRGSEVGCPTWRGCAPWPAPPRASRDGTTLRLDLVRAQTFARGEAVARF